MKTVPGSVIEVVAAVVRAIVERVTGTRLTQAEARQRAFDMLKAPPRRTELENEDDLRAIIDGESE